jgi:hypothetical protein
LFWLFQFEPKKFFVSRKFYSGGVCPAPACASPGCVCSTAACAVPEDGLQQVVVHLGCLSTRASAAPRHVCLQELCAAPGSVCLQEPVPHECMSVCQSFVLHLSCLSIRVLCFTWMCLSTRVQCMPYLEEHSLQKCFFFFFLKNRFIFFNFLNKCWKKRKKIKNNFFV